MFNRFVKLPEGIWRGPKMRVAQNGKFSMEHPIDMNDLEVPPF